MDDTSLEHQLAEAILAGTPVNWPQVEGAAQGGEHNLIAELKVLSRIVSAYQELPAPPSGTRASGRGMELRQFGPLQILEKIGEGSFGEVFRAWDARLEREVALKLLRTTECHSNPEPILATVGNPTMFLAEARQLARIRHTNVVTIHGADYVDGRVGLWMEFVEGDTLYQFIRAQSPLPAADVRAISIELTAAVAAVHASGLIHGDITPKNVMRDHTGRLVLMDFGAGRDQHELPSDNRQCAGTPVCMAPELLAGTAPTVKSDLYSLGAVLYYVATGSFPVMGRSVQEIRTAHESGAVTSLAVARPDVPASLAGIVDRLLSTNPALRPADAKSVQATLDCEDVRNDGRSVRSVHTWRQTRSIPNRGMAAVVLALILGAGAWLAMARAENSSASILPAGESAEGGAPVHPRSPITAGHLLFPVAGMHALQEVDPVNHSVIQTIPLPDGYSYGDPQMQVTTLVRRSDRSILTNARDRSGRPTLLVLSDRGELLHAQTVPSSFPAPRQYLQQIQFDASDPTQSNVLGGTPLTPTVVALNPFGGTVVTKITEANANFIGLQTDRQGRLYVANWSNGQVTRFVNSGSGGQLTQESLFADVRSDTGTSEVNGLAVDDDALYIAQCATRRVLKYVQSIGTDRRTTGTLSTSLADPDFTYPCSVSVHPATGRLYVGNQDTRTVVVFERDGTRVGTLMLGGSHAGLATVVPD